MSLLPTPRLHARTSPARGASPSRAALARVLVSLLAAGCTSGPSLSWEMSFATGVDAERASRVEGRILEGGCDGSELWSASAGRGEMPSMPPALEPGTYGFEGSAIDADCTIFAGACVERTLPLGADESVAVELAPTTELAACPASECSEGVCGAADGGSADGGGSDAGDRDSGPPDAGTDAGPPVDGGCTADCGECMRCVAGACAPASDGASCTDGLCHDGACCTGCVIAGACVAGDTAAACGSGGGACEVCECPTDACDAGACTVGRAIDDLAATQDHVCVIAAGSLFCFGGNFYGQLGLGTSGTGTEITTPTAPATSVASFESIAGGDDHVLAITAGTIHGWGSNSDGELGLGDFVVRTSPTPTPGTWAFVEAGTAGDHTCAIATDRTLYCTGQNDYSQLGLGDLVDRTSMTALPGAWRAVGLGHHHTCAISLTGTLSCWGENLDGQLGLGDSGAGTNRSTPTAVGAATDWQAIALGDVSTCGIRAPGDLYCWGGNTFGQLGQGDTTPLATPTRVGTDSDWASVRHGFHHVCATKTDGSLYCWGRNAEGQLGQGAAGGAVRAPTRTGTAVGWSGLALGEGHTCALDAASALHCWGDNTLGQLGQGDRVSRPAPTPVCW